MLSLCCSQYFRKAQVSASNSVKFSDPFLKTIFKSFRYKVFITLATYCTSKIKESIDVNFHLNLKQKKSEVNIRTVLNLPSGNDKKVKVAVICEEEKIEEAKKSGADIVGSDDLISNISSGKIEFEKLISTPKMMVKLGKLGKILGPKGLMPNPKLGTVTSEITKSVKDIKSCQV